MPVRQRRGLENGSGVRSAITLGGGADPTTTNANKMHPPGFEYNPSPAQFRFDQLKIIGAIIQQQQVRNSLHTNPTGSTQIHDNDTSPQHKVFSVPLFRP